MEEASEFNFLKNLKYIREEQGFTQKEMGIKIGISESFYSQIESGARRLTITNAIKIAQALDKTLDEIFLDSNLAKRH